MCFYWVGGLGEHYYNIWNLPCMLPLFWSVPSTAMLFVKFQQHFVSVSTCGDACNCLFNSSCLSCMATIVFTNVTRYHPNWAMVEQKKSITMPKRSSKFVMHHRMFERATVEECRLYAICAFLVLGWKLNQTYHKHEKHIFCSYIRVEKTPTHKPNVRQFTVS